MTISFPCHRISRRVLLGLFALLAGLLGACGADKPQAAKATAKASQDSIPVVVASVQRKSVPISVEGIGTVEAIASVAVKSRIDGQIVKVAFADGDDLKPGQLLFEIDRGQALTPADLQALESMLVEAGGSQEIIDKASEQAHGLGFFIRSLVGLDKEAVVQAFNQFLSGTTARPEQIEFIDLIVQELTQAGVMEADRLYQSPFIDINPLGPEGVFPSAKVDQLFKVLAELRSSAAA